MQLFLRALVKQLRKGFMPPSQPGPSMGTAEDLASMLDAIASASKHHQAHVLLSANMRMS